MATVQDKSNFAVFAWLALFSSTAILGGGLIGGEAPSGPDRETVVELRINGAQRFPLEKIIKHIHTRANRPYDPDTVEEDVRRLSSSRMFLDVKASTQQVPGGRIVIFQVVERPVLQYVKYVGCESINKKTLAREMGLKVGDAIDPYAVTEARRKIEDYYHSKGFGKVQVTIFEGDKPGDAGVVYVIHEGPKQRVLWTRFEGNAFAGDGRLRTQIKAKPGFLWLFGTLDRKQVDEDVNRLTAYYRSMGFFKARVSKELEFTEGKNWLVLTFVIDEGPRYTVRNVTVLGNRKIDAAELTQDAKLAPGRPFNQNEMIADLIRMQDLYQSVGYAFAKVEADPRFLEEPGTLDLVYKINEGEQYRVGRIYVQIMGENPHTKISTVLNRMSLYPGQVFDIRELRASERRLKSAQLFENNPITGNVPRITFSRPGLDREKEETEIAEQPKRARGYRGQSPDPEYPYGSPCEELWFTGGAATASLPSWESDRWGDGNLPPESPGAEPAYDPYPEPFEARPQDRSDASQQAPPAWESSTDGVAATIVRGQNPEPQNDRGPELWQPIRREASAAVFLEDSRRDGRPSSPPTARGDGRSLRWGSPTRVERPSGGGVVDAGYVAAGPERVQPAAALEPIETGTAGQPAWPSAGPVPQRPATYYARQPEVYRAQSGTYDANDGDAVPTLQPSVPAPRLPSLSAAADPRLPAGPAARTTSGYTARQLPADNSPDGGGPVPGPSGGNLPPGQPDPGYAGATMVEPPGPLLPNPFAGPQLYLPLRPELVETMTGKFMFSVGVNSDAGVLGSIIVDEQNFDWTRFPRSWEDIRNGTAWRGAGQKFRMEAMPGTQLQRYAISFTEPYLNVGSANLSESLSAFYYDRFYREWTERRTGGRVALGYQFLNDLWGTFAYRLEDVRISRPIVPHGYIPELDEVLGSNTLHGLRVQLTRDTRDNSFLPTEGYVLELGFEQVLGSFSYPRADLDARKYFLLRQHPDGSGRHVLSLSSRLAWSGSDTPIYEHFYAGGFSTIRGFEFRGVTPRKYGVGVGGELSLLSSAEYLFPVTADDMLRGVVFCDTGTIQPSIDHCDQRYRVSVGFGMRIVIPAMGPAPIALDFAFPLVKEPGDQTQVFSFFVGWMR